jgi:hypothetical protein
MAKKGLWKMARSGGLGRERTEAKSWKKKTSDTSQKPVERSRPRHSTRA